MIGKINSIETMGLVDGPGVRFVVFMQGCPLRCKFCHNPETWDFNIESDSYTPEELIKKILNYKPYFTLWNKDTQTVDFYELNSFNNELRKINSIYSIPENQEYDIYLFSFKSGYGISILSLYFSTDE